MSEPWMFEMSKHSMRRGSTSRSSRSWSARRISCDCLRGCFHSRSKASLALRTTSSSRRSFSPRWGVRMRTRVPRRWVSHCSSSSRSATSSATSSSRGHVAARRVELLDGVREHGLGLGEAVEEEALPGHHLPVAHAERLHGRPLALHVHAEEVALLDLRGRDLLRGLQPLEGATWSRRDAASSKRSSAAAPSIPPRRRFTHLLGAPLQEQPRVLAGLAVALEAADLGHARGEAALDLVLQAGPRTPAVERLLARADAEELAHEAGGLPAQARGDVGAAVDVAVLRGPPHHVEARVLLGQGQLQVRVVLVVAQPHVVRRLVALDQVVLEGERLHLVVGDHEVEVGDVRHHPALEELRGPRGLEVGADAVAEHAGLPHVEDLARGVLEEVHPGPQGQRLELLGEAHTLIIRFAPGIPRPRAPRSAARRHGHPQDLGARG